MSQKTTISTPPGHPQTTSPWPQLGVRRAVILGLLALLLAVFLLSVAVGSVNIPLEDVIKVLLGGDASRDSWTNIILKFRLPKALTAALAGAALAVSGLQMQTLFRNPLAGPFVLGISSGASLGVALVVLAVGSVGAVVLSGVSLVGDFGMAAAASLGAGLLMAIVLLVSRRIDSSVTLLILGLMFGYAVSAVVSLLLYFSIPERIQAYVNWTFGSFSGVTWDQLRIFGPAVILGLIICFFVSKPLNALLLGENYAQSMGLNIRRARTWVITSTAILAGAVTAFCGPIGFIGIAVPHLCRNLFKTSDHRILIPTSIIVGALITLLADLLAQVPGSRLVLPLSPVTALLGAPIVIWVILSQRKAKTAFSA